MVPDIIEELKKLYEVRQKHKELVFASRTAFGKIDIKKAWQKALALAEIKEENIPGIVSLGRAIFSRDCKLDKLSKVEQPTLILVREDDIPRPPRESEEMSSCIASSEIHIIEKAGHINNLK